MSANARSIKKLLAVSDLVRLPRQYGTLLVLWPTLWSLFIASDGRPGLMHLLVFILGTFLMRSAGCAINDIADRDFDAHVERTRQRPLASGRLSVREALFVFAVLCALAFALVLSLNRLAILLSFAGLGLAVVYPFSKRYFHLPQMVLGVAFGWGAIMAWAAATDTVGLTALLIFAANVFWSTAYDTIYALMDIEDDIRIGVKSTAILFGGRVRGALYLLYAGFAALLLLAGVSAGLGFFYYAGVGAAFAVSLSIVNRAGRDPTPEEAFRGFLANVGVGALVLMAIIVDLNF